MKVQRRRDHDGLVAAMAWAIAEAMHGADWRGQQCRISDAETHKGVVELRIAERRFELRLVEIVT